MFVFYERYIFKLLTSPNLTRSAVTMAVVPLLDRATADVIHDQGLLFGVYSAASQRTCGNYSASLFREMDDATTFANDWQIDMLKYDACIYNNGVASRSRYLAMSRALNATGRHIFYSVEGWEGTPMRPHSRDTNVFFCVVVSVSISHPPLPCEPHQCCCCCGGCGCLKVHLKRRETGDLNMPTCGALATISGRDGTTAS